MIGEGGADLAYVTDDRNPVNSTEGACGVEGTKGTEAVEGADGGKDMWDAGGEKGE